MSEFEENDIKEEAPKAEEQEAKRNTNAPTGWTYSANTNQYVSWEGGDSSGASRRAESEASGADRTAQTNAYSNQYGYYSNNPQGTNYYSSNGANPYGNSKNYQWDYNRYESADSTSKKKKKSSGKGFKVFIAIVAALLGCCVIALAGFGVYNLWQKITGRGSHLIPAELPEEHSIEEKVIETPPLNIEPKPSTGNYFSESGELAATEIYKTVSPSVVGVVIYKYSTSISPSGAGSGIIISEDGYIITNAHVVTDAEAVKVVLYNEEEYSADVIGSDTQTDIAVLKIDAENLSAAKLGDSDEIEVGETVYALGNPGGLSLQSSFTDGIISGINRMITTDVSAYTMTVLQTSAAINPGNSGGALINAFGQVVGIVNAKLLSNDYEGIGFAIPTSVAVPVVEELISKGYVSGRAILGITGSDIDMMMSQYYGVPQGVLIQSIDEASSFNETEAEVGDIITKYNGTTINGMDDLQNALTKSSPGDEVELTLYRMGAKQTNSVTFTVKVKLIEKTK